MSVYESIKERVIAYMPKEYYCHLQFVERLALEMQKEKGGDAEVIAIAAIAHDFGRVPDGDNDLHPEKGAEKILPILLELGYDSTKAALVARCVMMHNKTTGFESIEEQIIANADQLSKIAYIEQFMLMVKKETYEDRARWALKYLDKGMEKSTFADWRDRYREVYEAKRAAYASVIKD